MNKRDTLHNYLPGCNIFPEDKNYLFFLNHEKFCRNEKIIVGAGAARGAVGIGFYKDIIRILDLKDLEAIPVKGFMYTHTDGEYVEEDASLADATHQLIPGRHQSLIVVKNNEITGVLRLVYIFSEVCDLILTNNYSNL